MPNLTLSDEQVISLVEQLPPERKREVLLTLAASARTGQQARMDHAEAELRRLCAERGRDWNSMSEEERETFVDDLVHEDRPCGP